MMFVFVVGAVVSVFRCVGVWLLFPLWNWGWRVLHEVSWFPPTAAVMCFVTAQAEQAPNPGGVTEQTTVTESTRSPYSDTGMLVRLTTPAEVVFVATKAF
eukprot:TRINITY_DN36232_c0_g1_i1.p2 TRINITY_DN36232_c0_g1~~TRINITY_DN36232_c0_g1_i1.p2  ORF type:complete len:100 (+),score=7.91 TRINITY_DN36232_c0_g1_i1:150-449(+)